MPYTLPAMRITALPLQHPVSGLLTCLLIILLAGCNADEADSQPQVSPKSPVEQQLSATSDAPTDSDSPAPPLPAPVKPFSTPAPAATPASSARIAIKVDRATDSIDIEALQSGSKLPVPPLQLSIDLFNAPLRAVLRELARKIDAKVSIADDVPDQLLSMQLTAANVPDVIKQILRETNYVLIYKDSPPSAQQNQPATNALMAEIAEIRVLPKSNAEVENTIPTLKTLEPADQSAELEQWKKQALTAEKPEDRIAALKQFLEHADSSEHNALLIAALEDKSPEVRKFALSSMSDSANPLFEPISQAALNDENPQLRTAALNVLISRYGADAIPVLEQALTDPDSGVQQTAKSSLEMAQRIKSQMDALLHRKPK